MPKKRAIDETNDDENDIQQGDDHRLAMTEANTEEQMISVALYSCYWAVREQTDSPKEIWLKIQNVCRETAIKSKDAFNSNDYSFVESSPELLKPLALWMINEIKRDPYSRHISSMINRPSLVAADIPMEIFETYEEMGCITPTPTGSNFDEALKQGVVRIAENIKNFLKTNDSERRGLIQAKYPHLYTEHLNRLVICLELLSYIHHEDVINALFKRNHLLHELNNTDRLVVQALLKNPTFLEIIKSHLERFSHWNMINYYIPNLLAHPVLADIIAQKYEMLFQAYDSNQRLGPFYSRFDGMTCLADAPATLACIARYEEVYKGLINCAIHYHSSSLVPTVVSLAKHPTIADYIRTNIRVLLAQCMRGGNRDMAYLFFSLQTPEQNETLDREHPSIHITEWLNSYNNEHSLNQQRLTAFMGQMATVWEKDFGCPRDVTQLACQYVLPGYYSYQQREQLINQSRQEEQRHNRYPLRNRTRRANQKPS